MLKKVVALLSVFILAFSTCACSKSSKKEAADSSETKVAKRNDKNETSSKKESREESGDKNDADGDEEPEKSSSAELVKYYEEIRPKVTAFFKEKLEEPNKGNEDGATVTEDKVSYDIKGYRGVNNIIYDDTITTQNHYSHGVLCLALDSSRSKATGVNTVLMQYRDDKEIENNGIKLEDTLFKELIDLATPDNDKIDYKELDKLVSEKIMSEEGVTKVYGHTIIKFEMVEASLSMTINVK